MQINSKILQQMETIKKKHTKKKSREQKAELQKHVTYNVAEQI